MLIGSCRAYGAGEESRPADDSAEVFVNYVNLLLFAMLAAWYWLPAAHSCFSVCLSGRFQGALGLCGVGYSENAYGAAAASGAAVHVVDGDLCSAEFVADVCCGAWLVGHFDQENVSFGEGGV